jgi:hypothetical protein
MNHRMSRLKLNAMRFLFTSWTLYSIIKKNLEVFSHILIDIMHDSRHICRSSCHRFDRAFASNLRRSIQIPVSSSNELKITYLTYIHFTGSLP